MLRVRIGGDSGRDSTDAQPTGSYPHARSDAVGTLLTRIGTLLTQLAVIPRTLLTKLIAKNKYSSNSLRQ